MLILLGGVKMIGLIFRTQPTLSSKKLCNTYKHPPPSSPEKVSAFVVCRWKVWQAGFKVSPLNNSLSRVFLLNNGELLEWRCLFLPFLMRKCWLLVPVKEQISQLCLDCYLCSLFSLCRAVRGLWYLWIWTPTTGTDKPCARFCPGSPAHM